MLVDEYGRPMFRLAYRMTGNEQDAEDVVQETFVRAYRRLDQFESRAHFASWLHRIAANYSIDLIRRKKRWRSRALDETQEHATLKSDKPSFCIARRHKNCPAWPPLFWYRIAIASKTRKVP